MTAYLTPSPKMQFFDNNGNPLVGGQVFTYAAGTSTPQATYTTQAGTVPNTNPVILDSRGEAGIWLNGALFYDITLKTSTGELIYTVEKVGADTSAVALSALQASSGASLVGFNVMQAYAAGTVQAALQDTGVSIKNFPYLAYGDGVTDDTVAIQNCINDGHRSILIPTGDFRYSTLTVDHEVTFHGLGQLSKLASSSVTGNSITITCEEPVNFRDLTLGTSVAKTAGAAIIYTPAALTQNNNSRIERVAFNSQFNSINFDRAAYWFVDSCNFQNNGSQAGGVSIIVNNKTTADSGDSTIQNCGFYNGSHFTHVQYNSGGGLRVINNKFLAGDFGLAGYFDGTTATGILIVTGNSFDGQVYNSLSLNNASLPSYFTNVVIGDNSFNGDPLTSFVQIQSLAGSAGIQRGVISGNQFTSYISTVLQVNFVSGSFFLIGGNQHYGPSGCTSVSIGLTASNITVGPDNQQGTTYSIVSTSVTVLGAPAVIIAPTLNGTWVNYGAGTATAGYFKDSYGMVHIRGRVKDGVTGTSVFTLPVGFRPLAQVKFPISENNVCIPLYITAAGDLMPVGGGNTELSLDGILFATT